MPPINRVQVRALLNSGTIDENTANFYLNRLDAGQTVDVPERLIEQANQALVPETLPSPATQALQAVGGAVGAVGGTVGRALGAGLVGSVSPVTPVIAGVSELFQDQPNPAFRPVVEPGTPAETLFGQDATEAPTAAPEEAPGFDLSDAVGRDAELGQLTPEIGVDGEPTGFVYTATGDRIIDPGPAGERLRREQETRRLTEEGRQRAVARQERTRAQLSESRQFQREREEAQLERDAALQRSVVPALLALAGQPGGEFLTRATVSRLQGQTPVFNTGDLSAISPDQFGELFELPSGAGGGGTTRDANTTLTSIRTGVPINQLQGRPELLAGAVGGGGIAATGNQPLRITPNVQQLMDLTGLQAAELNAIAPQLFGQDFEDLQSTARRLAPPAVGRPISNFR